MFKVNYHLKSPNTTISFSQEQLITQKNNQSYSSFSSMPSNIVEVHKIVSLTEYSYGMMNTFFENLKKFTTEKITILNSMQEYSQSEAKINDNLNQEVLNQILLNV